MSAIYVTEQGAVVRRSDQHIVITKGKERIGHFIPFKVDYLLLFGRIQVTAEAVELILQEGIDIAYLTMNGKLRGRLVATESKNMLLRIAQYDRNINEEFKVDLARILVKGKLRNGRSMLMRYRRNYPETDIDAEIKTIETVIKKIDNQQTVNSLMGSEGVATAAYFRAFGKMFRSDFRFETRTRRPPKDPVNAVLSLGYTMITNEILSLLIAHGFDPYIGFLHGMEYGRPSLALDMVEEFRHPVIDRLTLFLFNKDMLKSSDFRPVEGEGIYLTPEALKLFFKYYEGRMRGTLSEKMVEDDQNYRDILKRQIRNLNQKIQFNQPYKPFRVFE